MSQIGRQAGIIMANGKINTKAKDLKIECTDTKKSKLYDFLDKKLILYFYPKDLTPGCTTESIEFNDNLSKIKKLKANVVGVSRDKLSLHEKFIAKHGFKFPLISDPEEKLCKSFDVIKEKSLYTGEKFFLLSAFGLFFIYSYGPSVNSLKFEFS